MKYTFLYSVPSFCVSWITYELRYRYRLFSLVFLAGIPAIAEVITYYLFQISTGTACRYILFSDEQMQDQDQTDIGLPWVVLHGQLYTLQTLQNITMSVLSCKVSLGFTATE